MRILKSVIGRKNRRRVIPVTLISVGLILITISSVFAEGPPGRGDRDGRRPPPPPPGENRGQRNNDNPPQGGNNTQASDGSATDTNVSVDTSSPTVALSDARILLGGDNTVFDASLEAFTNPLPLYGEDKLALFDEGDELFEQDFVVAVGEDRPDDGLGPVFNATSCEACHLDDGRGRPPEFPGEAETGFLIRVALPELELNGHTLPDPTYGGQFQDVSIDGVGAEGDIQIQYTEVAGTFADGTPYSLRMPSYSLTNLNYGALHPDATLSPRVANQMIGLGLLEAIPEETILAFADPTDVDVDGISGRPNVVWDVLNNRQTLGRFGWKASNPSLMQQTAGAFNQDMGIASSLFPNSVCMETEVGCFGLLSGGAPEISDDDLHLVALYSSSLAVPAQRNPDDALVQAGERIFHEAQCASCHVPEVQTGLHLSIPELSNQTIRPYTDLLLHDMGEGLADGQTDFLASGQEWRTPPLWGIGLIESINGHSYFLHDGRARNLMEAVLWHGGEAEASRNFVLGLNATEREALLAFLRSL